MDKTREKIQKPIENPFEKVKVEDLNDNYELIAYLFAKPEEAIYNKLISRENYRIIGGWGSGKTMLLKYISFKIQAEILKKEFKEKTDFIGIYLKMGQSGFKPFLKPGGEFKKGGETLFGHYFNLLILEKILSIIIYARERDIFKVFHKEENGLAERILSKFSIIYKGPQIGFKSPITSETLNIQSIKNKVERWRLEIETFLNTRDLEEDLSYRDVLSVHPTSIGLFLNEVFQDIKDIIKDISRKRFYLLLDECDLISIGQQKVINTIIKPRFTTMVFKIVSRPPDIKTMKTIEEGVGLTDREIKKFCLDEMYDPTSRSYKNLCHKVAEKRLDKFNYPIKDIRKILGTYKVEDYIAKEEIESYLRKKYPNKQRKENNFKEIYKDFKVAASFQILRDKKLRKKYAGFDTFVMLSSGIMLHFLELCRDAFTLSSGEYIIVDETGNITFKSTPLPVEIQNKAAQRVSEDFYHNIEGRAESLKDTDIEMEFGGKIQYIISVLGDIFENKLMTYNEPEAARIEIPEGKSSLDHSSKNPLRQIFENAIMISVFQEGKPYRSKHFGGIRPPTYILNRVLAPYLGISPRPRWRTIIPVNIFNTILKVNDREFKSEVLKGKGKKKKETAKKIEKIPKPVEGQLTLPIFQISQSMPILSYLSNKIKNKPFSGKTLLILLHFLRDLIPFIACCKKVGALPSNTIMFYKNYQYPNKEKIEHDLKKQGYKIYPLKELHTILKQLELKDIEDVIIIEDGGHIVPKLHKDFKNIAKVTLGAVEQTTKGIRNDVKIDEHLFPVISIPGSNLKDTFEPPHVARAVINNVQKLLPDKNLSGRKALVIGFGNIGEQVALQLRDTLKMQVTIHDFDKIKLVKARQYGFEVQENLEAGIKEKFLIIGTTGETIIKRSEILAMEHNIYLISASSEQWEFCISELEALSSKEVNLYRDSDKIGTKYKIRNTEKYVNLIADGYPINFWKTESMPNEVSDLIISLIFVSALEIVTNPSLPRQINHDIVNDLDKRYELSKIYLEYYK